MASSRVDSVSTSHSREKPCVWHQTCPTNGTKWHLLSLVFDEGGVARLWTNRCVTGPGGWCILRLSPERPRGKAMSAPEPRLSREELARRGDDAFTRQVRPTLRPEDDGKFVAIDVESGIFE